VPIFVRYGAPVFLFNINQLLTTPSRGLPRESVRLHLVCILFCRVRGDVLLRNPRRHLRRTRGEVRFVLHCGRRFIRAARRQLQWFVTLWGIVKPRSSV